MPETTAPLDVGIMTAHLSFDRRGGSNHSIHHLADELETRGHDATVYTLNFEHNNNVPRDIPYRVVEELVGSGSLVSGAFELLDRLPECVGPHDVFHVYIPGIIPLVGLHRWLTDQETPIVATLNGYTTFCTNTAVMADGCWNDCTLVNKFTHARGGGVDRLARLHRMAFNDLAGPRLMNQLDEYFCLSPAVRDIHRGVGIEDERLRVVPNMYDPSFEISPPVDTPEPRILYVGRLEDMKGISVLLDAAARMSAERFQLDIVGDNLLDYGPDIGSYRHRVRALEIDDRVSFHGWVDHAELGEHYATADVFVHPGLWPEPFGRTLLEAMQHGLPIVCSDVGGPPWICGDAGVSYPRTDADALARTLDDLVTHPNRRAELAQETDRELERFAPDHVMDEILGSYRSVIADR
jgi:glycosyltransferase involved in cell wall biosynthesis